jgi:hypothetical protein
VKRSGVLVKIVVAVAALAVFGFLFMRSIEDTRSTPYEIEAAHLQNWTLAIEPATEPGDSILALQAPPDLANNMFRQVFARAMESLNRPLLPGIPLLLKREFDSAFADRVTQEDLLAAAKAAGLDSLTLTPRCLGHQRVSAPGVTRQVFFVLFDAPAISQFRERLAMEADGAASRAGFDPASLSPVMLIAAAESTFGSWLPLRVNPDTDCLAPIVTP